MKMTREDLASMIKETVQPIVSAGQSADLPHE